jgi:hypothetical protein
MKKPGSILMIALAVVAIALLGLAFTRNLIDFPVYHAAGRSLVAGRTDLYAADFALGPVMDYRYPPFFLLAFYPLWLMDYSVAAYIWYLLSAAQIVACVLILRRVVDRSRPSRVVWLTALLAVAQYFVMILHYGNAHLLAISLMFASFYLLMRRRDSTAALLMSLSITLKLVPVLILPYFALKKRWKYLGLTAAFVIAINLVLPAAYFGPAKNAELLNGWFNHVIVNQQFHEMNGPINLSLKGQLRRYLSEVDYSARVTGDTRYPAVNVASMSPKLIETLWMILAAAAFIACLAIIRLAPLRDEAEEALQAVSPSAMPLELSLMICLMLFVGPLTSKIYFIALLWPAVCLGVEVFGGKGAAARFGKAVLIIISVVNFVLPLLPGRSVQRLLLVLGIDFYINLLLLLALGCALISIRRRNRVLSGERQKPALSSAKTP